MLSQLLLGSGKFIPSFIFLLSPFSSSYNNLYFLILVHCKLSESSGGKRFGCADVDQHKEVQSWGNSIVKKENSLQVLRSSESQQSVQ